MVCEVKGMEGCRTKRMYTMQISTPESTTPDVPAGKAKGLWRSPRHEPGFWKTEPWREKFGLRWDACHAAAGSEPLTEHETLWNPW